LLDVVVGGELHGSNVDLNHVFQEILQIVSSSGSIKPYKAHICKFLHILWPCSAKHQCLTIRTDLRYNLAYLGLETHVQHAISLIHD
jgi:hypothetical protein